MKSRTLTIIISALLASAMQTASAGEIISVPVAASAQQGKVSKFKQFFTLDSRISALDKTLPLQMSMSMFQTQKYGYLKDGLIPVTTSLSFGQFSGNIGGKSFTQDLAKAIKSARVPKLPTVTAFMTQSGDLRKIKMTGLPNTKGPVSMMIPRMDQLTAASMNLLPPTGALELGRSIRRQLSFPVQGAKIDGQIGYTPVEVTEAGGEPVVKIVLDGDGSITADLAALAKSSHGASASSALPASGQGHAIITGNVLIGLNSGELVRQDIKVALFVDLNVMGQAISGDMDIVLGGYRMPRSSQVAAR